MEREGGIRKNKCETFVLCSFHDALFHVIVYIVQVSDNTSNCWWTY